MGLTLAGFFSGILVPQTNEGGAAIADVLARSEQFVWELLQRIDAD